MDPFYSYATRLLRADLRMPTQPNTCTLKVLGRNPEDPGNLEFDTRLDAITAASGYIARYIHNDSLTCRLSERADHVQLLLKHVETGVYDPSDVSRRYTDKHSVVFGQIDFYLFCIRMECPNLCDIVRVGIQSGLDIMAWGPTPGRNDCFWDGETPVTFLVWLFECGGSYFKKLPDGDAAELTKIP
ncbi:hypothetical protein K440DRAFT_665240 [Wilcoxina mikolae CBS 423.85]|nr:hypothetical protein K440DRAFT_665240 [Wilcoxina mikolae CBS 423.85]